MAGVKEAVICYESGRMQRCMQWPEFEAILDRYIPLQELSSQSTEWIYVHNNADQWSCVLFTLAFDEQGLADERWNLPLQRLCGQAPLQSIDGVMLRLMQAGECRVSAIRSQLWDLPEQQSRQDFISSIQSIFERSELGFSRGDSNVSSDSDETSSENTDAASTPGDIHNELRDLNLRVADLKAALTAFKSNSERERAALLKERESLSRHWQEKNTLLRDQIKALEAQITGSDSSLDGEGLLKIQKRRFQHDLVHLRDQLREQRRENEILRQELDALRLAGDSSLLKQLMDAGVSFVVCHPGVDDLLLPLSEAQRYLQDPLEYIAAHCGVSKAHYEAWLEHWRMPVCAAAAAEQRCGKTLEPVSQPASFIAGVSDRCETHKA